MRRIARSSLSRSCALGLTAVAATAAVAFPANAVPTTRAVGTPANVAPYLAEQLGDLGDTAKTAVLVHGTDLAAANAAVAGTGMSKMTSFDKIAVVGARGTKAQIAAVRTQPGITYVEGNTPIEFTRRPRTPPPVAMRRSPD